MKDLKYIAGEISKGKNLDINLEKKNMRRVCVLFTIPSHV